MEKALELYDAWLQSQKDFLNNWTGSQKELMDNWLESVKKIQMSFGAVAGTHGGSQQLFDLFSSWFNTMLNSSKAFTEGITNLQNAWKTTIEKQMEMSREASKHIMDLLSKAGTK
jgi:cytoplasmic iron level regulating protein YaaA (DUF328/UPF0246 family)